MSLSFSQRQGIKSVKTSLQIASMDMELRNGLWNALDIYYWEKARKDNTYGTTSKHHDINQLVRLLWKDYFKTTLDAIPYKWNDTYQLIKSYFYNILWYEVYDFIEFVANNFYAKYYSAINDPTNKNFMNYCNQVFEQELSAYRFVGTCITNVTSEQEIEEIEQALIDTTPLKPVHLHLNRALELFSDKTSPDYRNSMKESISAVEAICRIITDNSKSTLGDALNQIEKAEIISWHPALKRSFSQLYGYTNDADGIRHALKIDESPSSEDARFMLVSCSAFINYLISKADRAGIKLT